MSTQEASQTDETFLLPNGRTLAYSICGSAPSPTTPTIFHFHGFPGSRIEGLLWLGSSLSPMINARLICIDRPGFGLSSFQPNRRILDIVPDLLALADHLKVDKFHVIAISGGAPYALACAKEIPRNRLISTAVVSGLYSPDLSREGMMLPQRIMMFVGYWAPTSAIAYAFDWKFGTLARNPDPKPMEDALLKEMQSRPAKDLECFEIPEFRQIMARSVREAFRQEGGMGPAWDLRLYGSDWGFDLKDIDGNNVTLWHGMADVNTPFSMAQTVSKSIKGCEFKGFQGETHTSLPCVHAEEILKGLLNIKD